MLRLSTFVAFALSTALVTPALAQSAGAKNVIVMISDGIAFNGWLAADYFQGKAGSQSYQVTRPDGTEPVLFGSATFALNLIDASGRILADSAALETVAGVVEQGYDPMTRWSEFYRTFRNDFPPVGIKYTSYADSAAAGTALFTGYKTANGRINTNWDGTIVYPTIAEIADAQGRATGAVTTVQTTHATPAAVASHTISRNNTVLIFNELLASGLDVIMGAGHPDFDRSGRPVEPTVVASNDPNYSEEMFVQEENRFQFVGGSDTWARLTSEEGLNGFAFIDEKSDFEALAAGENLPEKVVGIVRAHRTTQTDREGWPEADTPSGMAFIDTVPSLATMTVGALNMLGRNENGFFLMSEGGAVDWMGHSNNMPRYIEEQIDFNLAVDAVIEWVEANSSWDETLLIVTSDHDCGGIWGEGTWTNSVGGPVAASMSEADILAARFNPAEDTFHEFRAVQNRGEGALPGFQWSSGEHTNELVPLWALGVGSEKFARFARYDLEAGKLWGEGTPYDWDGRFVDITAVFHVTNEVFAENHARRSLGQ